MSLHESKEHNFVWKNDKTYVYSRPVKYTTLFLSCESFFIKSTRITEITDSTLIPFFYNIQTFTWHRILQKGFTWKSSEVNLNQILR